jgi:hypothetical protein
MVANRIYKNCIWEGEIKAWLNDHKIMQDAALASALYTTVKFGKEIHPFTTFNKDNKVTVTYTKEPASYTLVHQDAVGIMLKLLDGCLRQGD